MIHSSPHPHPAGNCDGIEQTHAVPSRIYPIPSDILSARNEAGTAVILHAVPVDTQVHSPWRVKSKGLMQ